MTSIASRLSTATVLLEPASAQRPVPPLGGLNLSMLRIEVLRVLRNRRTLMFAVLFPAAMFVVFGSNADSLTRVGEGNVSAYVMVSMATYGASLAAASTGAGVALERSLGWSRQLRLTPLNPVVYIIAKALVAVVMGAVAIIAVNITGLIQGKPAMPLAVWAASAGLTLVGVLTFAALGVFVGYLVPGENVMQILGPGLALLAMIGGLFIPLGNFSPLVRGIAAWTPMYGVAEIARAPLTHELPWLALANTVAWLVIFVVGAAWRMRGDTGRV